MQWKVVCSAFVTALAFAASASAQSSAMLPHAAGKPCLSNEAKAEINRIRELNRSSAKAQDLPFDPEYFLGTWQLEWDVPESPLGEAGTVTGTMTIRHVDDCSYEGDVTGEDPTGPFTSKIKITYDPAAKRLDWAETHSRGYTIVRSGRITGDPGGVFTHSWEAPAVKISGRMISQAGTTILTSPSAYRLRAQISIDGEPYRNFGNPWVEKK
jgi:hypothetical protein